MSSFEKRKHKLQNSWNFAFEKVHEDWSRNGVINAMESLGSFESGEEFWIIYEKVLLNLTKLDKKESIHMMRRAKNGEIILPIWEDPENINGGEWTFRVDVVTKKDGRDITQASKAWENILCAIIGEMFDDVLENDEICGLSISARERDFVFQLWHKNANSTKKDDLLKKVKSVLGTMEIKSVFHKSHVKETK